MNKSMKLKTTIAALTLALTFAWVTDAAAQRGRGGGFRLDPEKADAAWSLQAQGVAKQIEVSGDALEKLTKAYKAARKSQGEAIRELMSGGGGGGPGRFMEMREISEEERGKLREALDAFLNDDQTKKAVESLGTFSGQWDRFVNTIAGFQLEEKKLYMALNLIAKNVVESDAARSEAMANMDFESMRTATQNLKANLDDGLAMILSKEDFTKWTEATARRGRGRGGFGGGGGGGGAVPHGDGSGGGHN